jgi:SOS-response transcriptional repressor LexA
MNPTKDQIKIWLKHPDRNRAWLADACRVAKITVDRWLSSSIDVPPKQLIRIAQLMAAPEEKPPVSKPVESVLVIKTTPEENEAWSKAALAKGQILADWAITAIQSVYQAEQEETQRIIARSSIPPLASHPSHWIDLCGGIAAGSPISSDAPHEPIPVANAYPTDCYALRVFGHSMEPKIADGSTIVVQRLTAGNHPKQGKFVVYSDAYGLSLKKLAYRKAKAGEEANSLGKVAILESTNPDFPEVQTMDGGRIEAVFVASISPENILSPITLVPDSKIPSVEKQA